MVECRFFLQGRCIHGDTCRFEHPKPSSSTGSWRDTNPTTNDNSPPVTRDGSKPSICAFFIRGTCKFGNNCKQSHDLEDHNSVLQSSAADAKSKVVCTFFLRNACSKGASCPFSHAAGTSLALPKEIHGKAEDVPVDYRQHQIEPSNGTPRLLADSTSATRIVSGAAITFDDGAAVSKVALPADFSTVAISNIPTDASPHDVRNALKSWVPHDEIEVVAWKNDPQTLLRSAEVKVADGGCLCRDDLSEKPKLKLHGINLQIFPVHLATTETGTNRLQLGSVTCTWHNPSKTAYLRYQYKDRADRALSALQQTTRELHGRGLTFEHVQHSSATTYHPLRSSRAARARGMIYIVRVRNLDDGTSVKDLRQYLDHHAPADIELGSSSHSLSKHDLQYRVKKSLETYGSLLEWVVLPQPGDAKVKAYAKFANYDEAAHAAKELDGSHPDRRSKDVLHVQHVVSVKLPVSQRVLVAIRPQLLAMAQTSQSDSCVTIKAYENPHKAYTQVRVSGSDRTSVARVKMQVEALLAGHIVQDGTQPLTHPFFFQAGASSLLEEVMRKHNVVIIHDRRKMVLRMYGDMGCVNAAQEALKIKATEVDSQSKDIVLDSQTFVTAMRGGLQGIVAALGKSMVKLDITSNPKRILISGSDDDVKLANCILQSSHVNLIEDIDGLTISDGEDSLCAVCWTPAEDPVTTTCGHSYCSDCLASQASSTADFPMCCLGDSGKCNVPFTLPELRRMLTIGTYDELLESSLTKHIRSHPKDFTYCLTPDCDRFYRISHEDSAIVFNCDHCLSSICTACHNAAHDRDTCAQAKSGRDGTDDFAEYKKNNDVRGCPNCATLIEKSEGCNHMECRSCHAHICWQCMKVFERGAEVYGHMTKDHKGDWGLGWRRGDFE